MDDEKWLWPSEEKDFWEIEFEETKVKINWSKNPFEDYSKLAFDYYTCGLSTLEYIIECDEKYIENEKNDSWFLAAVFLMRHSLELGLKALICRTRERNTDIQNIFIEACHNLSKLFNFYLDSEELFLNEEEVLWLNSYFSNIEEIDEKSDLFRFPFDNDFLLQYRNKFLDCVDVANNLIQAFSLIKKCILCGVKPEEYFDNTLSSEFLILASHGFGNCYLWQPLSDDGFYHKVEGYIEVAHYIYKTDKIDLCSKVYPLFFLMRNTLELCLKRIFYSGVEKGV